MLQPPNQLIITCLMDVQQYCSCMAAGVTVMGVMGILWTMVPYSWAWIVTFTIFFGFNVGTVTSLPSTVLAEYFEGIELSNLLGLYFSVGAPTGG